MAFWHVWLIRALEPPLEVSLAHVAQQVEHILGKDEVHRFKPGHGLHTF